MSGPPTQPLKRLHQPHPILFSCKVTKRLFERACNFELPGVSVGFYICFLETTFSHSDGTDSVPESVCNGGPEEIREGHIFLRYIIYFWLQIWKLGSFSKSAKAPLSIRLSPNVGGFANYGTQDKMVANFGSTFWECPHPWALPITMHEAKVIMNWNICRPWDLRGRGFLHPLLTSGRNLHLLIDIPPLFKQGYSWI